MTSKPQQPKPDVPTDNNWSTNADRPSNGGTDNSAGSGGSSSTPSGSGWRTGIASAYGDSSDTSIKYPGTTATGDSCNNNSMGVAVPMSWPNYRSYFGRSVEIRYKGRTVIATVNDCGSFGKYGRDLDLQPGVIKHSGLPGVKIGARARSRTASSSLDPYSLETVYNFILYCYCVSLRKDRL